MQVVQHTGRLQVLLCYMLKKITVTFKPITSAHILIGTTTNNEVRRATSRQCYYSRRAEGLGDRVIIVSILLFATWYTLDVGPTNPPMHTRGHGTDHSSLSNTKLNNIWSYLHSTIHLCGMIHNYRHRQL